MAIAYCVIATETVLEKQKQCQKTVVTETVPVSSGYRNSASKQWLQKQCQKTVALLHPAQPAHIQPCY